MHREHVKENTRCKSCEKFKRRSETSLINQPIPVLVATELCLQTQSMHVEEAKLAATQHCTHVVTLCRPIQANPVTYCTYHCGPLSLLICCQTGRPGRKPWRDSCSNHIEGKKEERRQKDGGVETVKADQGLIPRNVFLRNFNFPSQNPFRTYCAV